MRIMQKMILGFLVVVVISMIAGIFVIIQLNTMNEDINLVKETKYPINKYASNYQRAGTQLWLGTYIYANGDQVMGNQYIRNGKTGMKEYREALSEFYDDSIITEFKHKEDSAISASDLVISTITEHEKTHPIENIDESHSINHQQQITFDLMLLQQRVEALNLDLSILVDKTQEEMTESLIHAEENAHFTINFSMIMAIAFFISSVLIAILLTRKITKPIKELKNVSDKLKDGDLEVNIPKSKSNDEIGDLAFSFDKMRISLKDLIFNLKEARNTLEIKVDERTKELKSSNYELTLEMENRKQTEKKLIVSNKKLKKTIKKTIVLAKKAEAANVAKSEFITVTSHEFGTPITILQGNIDLFLKGVLGELSDLQKKKMETLRISVERLSKLRKGTLMLTQIDNGELIINKEKIKINELIDDIVNKINPAIELKEQKIISKIKDFDVFCDKVNMSVIFDNLLSNANKYADNQSKIEINIEDEENNHHVIISDNGPGIAKEKQKKLFERFYIAHDYLNHKEGTGLGLAIVKEIVKAHDGNIWYEGDKGKGSAFHFTIPKL